MEFLFPLDTPWELEGSFFIANKLSEPLTLLEQYSFAKSETLGGVGDLVGSSEGTTSCWASSWAPLWSKMVMLLSGWCALPAIDSPFTNGVTMSTPCVLASWTLNVSRKRDLRRLVFPDPGTPTSTIRTWLSLVSPFREALLHVVLALNTAGWTGPGKERCITLNQKLSFHTMILHEISKTAKLTKNVKALIQ